ncbi:hypothetical protein [Cytobacillus oceanisediminis]|uniref:hypothetical protein n=1 Tax=Cytobacillus oceanisediminis TaxID=665099 RepID=UPI001C238097|nr:hypothetical protein [Cytobacillus oceanisediminis]MBU8768765.1 hypothetical protein [Cytobacillus oceanisediminis]
MGIFIDIKLEIVPLKINDLYGIEVIVGKEKMIINSAKNNFYIDLSSLAFAIDTDVRKLQEIISYSLTAKEYLAFYRDSYNKIIKVIDITCLNHLIRCLSNVGYDFRVLKTLKNQINKAVEQLGKE